jgi:hypothetical protein
MEKFLKSFVCLLLISTFSNTVVFAQNLLTNGDFESGGSGNGFIVNNTGYSPASNKGKSVPGNYSFVTDPSLMNSSFISGDTIFMNLNWVTLPFLRFTNLFKK